LGHTEATSNVRWPQLGQRIITMKANLIDSAPVSADPETLRLRRSALAGHAALAVSQVAFGLFPIFGVVAFRPGGLSPLGVGAWRVAGGAVALGGLAGLVHGARALPRRSDLLRFAACGVLGVALNQGLFLVGLSRSTPLNAGLVMSLIPVFTFALAALVKLERSSAGRAFGIGLALAGVLPLVFQDGLGTLGRYGAGNLLMVANALSYSLYLVLAKPLTGRYPALVVIAWSYFFSLPALAYFIPGQRVVPEAGATAAWWSLAYIVVFPTVLAYLLNVFALARLRASTTAIYVYFQPLVAGVASWMVFGERPSGTILLAAGALFTGLWLVARRDR
jgi:drug/metabolite transporter (DMT)-like permease